MVQVNLEETNDATFDVGTPRGLRGVERDLANGAHGPAERERSVDMLLTPPMVQRNRQTNGERERGGERKVQLTLSGRHREIQYKQTSR